MGVQKALLALVTAIAIIATAAVCVEVGSFFVVRRNVSTRIWTTHPGEQMRAYDQPWGKVLWQEQRRVLDFSYHPFLLRRSKPFAGAMINVDSAGVRRTVNPRCEAGAPLIWMFGGSTVWGFGNPDDMTIPSLISAEYRDRGQAACVVNFGEDAWTMGQGVIKLLQELKAAERAPDVVIFMNGCNDLFTPYRWTGNPALQWDYLEYRDALDELLVANRGSWGWFRLTNTATLWKIARKRWRGAEQPRVDRSLLAQQIANEYVANIRVVEGLAAEFGFMTFFYWQPMPFYGDKPLAKEELNAMGEMKAPIYRDGIDAASRVIPLIRAISSPHFRYLGDLFAGNTESLYLDPCHLQPAGNRLIARRIAGDVLGPQDAR